MNNVLLFVRFQLGRTAFFLIRDIIWWNWKFTMYFLITAWTTS